MAFTVKIYDRARFHLAWLKVGLNVGDLKWRGVLSRFSAESEAVGDEAIIGRRPDLVQFMACDFRNKWNDISS